ncbi:flagellar hook-length control protein FliK [Cohnella sp. JJ-181]|uniref:flagellar hook-length control protein FliK n=1 Tax=Cohnella rhizoplanae TaxID=2974897 RepID=UPI0022FFC3C5|nr:flagellar hook-length control protein FliK [Cohnella sp. JJ-181]CAI6026774.1 hypothetical protein COHCIP112018_00538 [Cohnella sp. JJ-181]
MNIQSTNAASGTNGGGAAAAKASAASGIFQGVLVQKIDAAGQTEGTGFAAANPMAGLLGLLTAAIGVSPDESQTEGETGSGEQLAQLLDGLEAQLSQLQQDTEVSDSLMNQMAELLASLQTLLQRNMLQAPASEEQTNANQLQGEIPNGVATTGQSQAPAVLPALQEVVKELRTLLQNGKLSTAEIAAAGAGIKSFAQAEEQIPAANATDRNKAVRSHPIFANREAPNGTHATEAAGTAEVKKAYPVFKEPVVYWNLNANAVSEEASPGAVSVSAESVSGVEEQPSSLNWQALTGDVASKSDSGAGLKPQAPVTVPGHQFAQQMDKFLVKQFTLSGGNGISEANINLHPEHLGEVQIRLTMQHGVLNAQFVTHNEAAKEMLENQMAQLRGTLQSQGIQVDRVEVVQQQPQTSESSAFLFQEQRRQQSGGGESNRPTGSPETLEEFEEELERSATLRDAGFGGSLNVTA